jgi:hypothetical protein
MESEVLEVADLQMEVRRLYKRCREIAPGVLQDEDGNIYRPDYSSQTEEGTGQIRVN